MIKIKDVTFSYETENESEIKKTSGIDNFNLEIKKGEFIVLSGNSGCGKTTVVRLINGLIPNYYKGKLEGNVEINGENITRDSISLTAKKVGSVFQNPRSQFFNVNTSSELAFPLENRGVEVSIIQERINRIVKELKIEDLVDRNLFKLSGGEKQKIACGSVAVSDTDIVVLDEPSSNLDIFAIEKLRILLKNWKEQGKTIIIAEQRLYFLRDLADRMIVMKNGKINCELSKEDMNKISVEQIKHMGLRTLDMGELKSKKNISTYEEKLVIENLKFRYPRTNYGISIDHAEIKKGSIVAVIGKNGAGKTTFAKCMCGLNKKCKGVLKTETGEYNNKTRLKNCYMVMQDVNHQLFMESIYDEVELSLQGKKKINEKEAYIQVKEILKDFDLSDYGEKHPMALSGGQKQRVAIAAAVASNREVLILDEPTSGLDYLRMIQVAEYLKKISKLGRTIFIITHDLELIMECCTDVMHLEGGELENLYELKEEKVQKLNHFFNTLKYNC